MVYERLERVQRRCQRENLKMAPMMEVTIPVTVTGNRNGSWSFSGDLEGYLHQGMFSREIEASKIPKRWYRYAFPSSPHGFLSFNSFSIHIFVRSISVGWIGSGIGALKSCFWEVCGVHQWYLKAILGLQESEYAICTNPMSTGLQKHLAFSWGKHIAYLCNMQQNRSVLNLIITA